MTTPTGTRLVSIGVPTYNRVVSLERALKSALAQDYEAVEIIISDNASTDGTGAFCEGVAATDARVRYIRQSSNRGAAANFRTVLAEAHGEFFMWLGDDDWMDKSYVSRCVSILGADPSYSIVAGSDRYFVGEKFDRDGLRLNLEERTGQDRVASYFRQVSMNGVFYGLMRRNVVSSVPIDDILGGDWFMVAAMAFLGKIRVLDDVYINRSADGVSSDASVLTSKFQLSKFQRANPFLTIAISAFTDIAWRSSVYASLGTRRRIALAGQVFRAIVRRHYSPGHVPTLARQLFSLRGT